MNKPIAFDDGKFTAIERQIEDMQKGFLEVLKGIDDRRIEVKTKLNEIVVTDTKEDILSKVENVKEALSRQDKVIKDEIEIVKQDLILSE